MLWGRSNRSYEVLGWIRIKLEQGIMKVRMYVCMRTAYR